MKGQLDGRGVGCFFDGGGRTGEWGDSRGEARGSKMLKGIVGGRLSGLLGENCRGKITGKAAG